MSEPTQPADEPYDVGDRVRIQAAVDDADSQYEGTVCRIVHVFTDRPGIETEPTGVELETDRAAYRVRAVDSEETLPVVFPHRDLRPAPDS